MYNLAKQITMKDKSLRTFSVFVSVVVKHFTRPEGINKFKVYGSVHPKYIPIYIKQDATLHSLFISVNCSTCFEWYFYPSSEEHTTVFTASGICHAVTATATCRYSDR
jgi:hypothetical protein